MSVSCRDCRFADDDVADSMYRRCRVRPPRVARDHSHAIPAVWAVVSINDWCGEHQPIQRKPKFPVAELATALDPFLAVAGDIPADAPETVYLLDQRDAEGEPLQISSADFRRLAAAWAAMVGA